MSNVIELKPKPKSTYINSCQVYSFSTGVLLFETKVDTKPMDIEDLEAWMDMVDFIELD